MMKMRVLLAAFVLLMSAVGAMAQNKPDSKPAPPKTDPKAAAKVKEKLMHPEQLKDKAPETFKAKFETTKGDFIVDVTRSWSPNGADRFYNLVKYGFFDGVKFFRVVPGFVVQFGIHGDPDLATKWLQSNIPDDKVVQSNKRGFLTYAKSGAPNSRSTQLFINLADNDRLDSMGFSAFGKVSKGMDVVDKLYGGYGEQLTQLQGEIAQEGNKFLEENFPKLDAIKKATIVK
ncbi:MAG TPA: peptidylprolyl isomerase [Chthonomonadaceae bacterium]|nr:peptidylprolyl isomerase [Chthonomonadaceae bacterium]